MHSFKSLALAFTLAVGACEGFTPEPAPQIQIDKAQDNVVDDTKIIVLLNSLDASATLLGKAERLGYRLRERRILTGLSLVMLDLDKPRGLSGSAAIRELEGLEPRATVGVDHRYTLQQGAFTEQSSNTALEGAKFYASMMIGWPLEGCPAHAKIGMIDGRVSPNVARAPNTRLMTRDFSGGDPETPPDEHGTAVAELLVGPGRLTDANLYVATVVDDSAAPAASVTSIILSLDWLQRADAKVVNISLAGPYNKLLDRAVSGAARSGMILVAAVGNDGAGAPPRYPAAFDEVLAVTAVDRDGLIYEQAIRGGHVDVAAPGVDVYVNALGDGKFITGTSIAAPFVTARIAADPELTRLRDPRRIAAELKAQTRDLGPRGPDPIYGAGLVAAQRLQCLRD